MPNNNIDYARIETVLDKMKALAVANRHNYLTFEHMLLALLTEQEIVDVINETDGDLKGLSSDLDKWMVNGDIPKIAVDGKISPRMTKITNEAIQQGVALAVTTGKDSVVPLDLLIGMLQYRETATSHFLEKNGIKLDELLNLARHTRGIGEDQSNIDENDTPMVDGNANQAAAPRPHNQAQPDNGTANGLDAEQRRAKKVLERFTTNLNVESQEGRIDPLIGREDVVDRIVNVAAQRRKNNLIILGDPGVGKTAIVEGLASKIVKGDVPEMFKDATIFNLDVTELLAGAKFRGDVEERIKSVLKALKTTSKPILFIDEIHMIVGAGNGGVGAMDLSNILKPALARGELRCIGTTTAEEYRKHFERDRALTRRFQTFDVEQPTIDEAIDILKGLKKHYEAFHNVTYTDGALESAVRLSVKYVHNKFLPDKAIDMIDAAGAVCKIRSDVKEVTETDIETEVARISRLPMDTIRLKDSNKLETLESDIKSVVFGQSEAIDKIVSQVILSKAGLRETDKTRGAYLLVGPTGTGKTELTKQLAKTLGIPLVRYDMSEFMEKHTISRLIGSPPGYVGYNDGNAGSGGLISAIEKTPECVLLLDEIEKAHPSVLNVFLQMMDNGVVSASNGKSVSARNLYLMMTSNLGAADTEQVTMGFLGGKQNDGAIDEAVKHGLSPEFRNRLDAVIKFDRLTPEISLMVVDKFIKDLKTMLEPKKVELQVDDALRNWLVEKGFNPKMGGRPLARCIQENIKVPLSKELVFGELKNGGTCRFDITEDKLTLKVITAV